MKRIIALLLAVLMLTATAVFAESADEAIVVYEGKDGAQVTLAMKGEYSIEYEVDSIGDYVRFTISRDGVQPVKVVIAAVEDDTCYTLNDLTDEVLESWRSILAAEENVTSVTVDVTPSGNKYFTINYEFGDGSIEQERYTVFQGFEMSRYQISENGALTDADIAFCAEVQEGLWTKEPTVAE